MYPLDTPKCPSFEKNRFGRPFLPAEGTVKAIRFRGRLSQWVEAEFYAPAFSRDFSLEFQIVTFRNRAKKIL